MARSMSASVLKRPKLMRSDACAHSSLRPSARSTWLGCWLPELQADPLDHMARVRAQGDLRPMAASGEAMDDLKRILAGRAAFYAKADMRVNTSDGTEDEVFARLSQLTRAAIGSPV